MKANAPARIKPVKGARIDAAEAQYMIGRLNEIRRMCYAARFEKAPGAILKILAVAGDALAVAEGRSRDKEERAPFSPSTSRDQQDRIRILRVRMVDVANSFFPRQGSEQNAAIRCVELLDEILSAETSTADRQS